MMDRTMIVQLTVLRAQCIDGLKLGNPIAASDHDHSFSACPALFFPFQFQSFTSKLLKHVPAVQAAMQLWLHILCKYLSKTFVIQ
eukprot:15133424-Ditylum_brightwellii.AAC.1